MSKEELLIKEFVNTLRSIQTRFVHYYVYDLGKKAQRIAFEKVYGKCKRNV